MNGMGHPAGARCPFWIRASDDASGLSIARSGLTLIGTSPAFKGYLCSVRYGWRRRSGDLQLRPKAHLWTSYLCVNACSLMSLKNP